LITALNWSGRARGKPAQNRDSEARATESKQPSEREASWIRAAQRGDRKALDELVRLYQDRVYGFLYRMTNDRDLALDLAQDTFIKAFKGLKGFKSEAALGPWLLAIARNCFLDHTRRVAADISRVSYLSRGRSDSLEDIGSGVEDPALVRLASDTGVLEALAQVPSPLREALVLRHIEDLSYEQIAEALDAPLGTVKTWIHRGRTNLRNHLEKGGGA
jgi:RNA polymerase sigma-70 factor (ECF subfamily)